MRPANDSSGRPFFPWPLFSLIQRNVLFYQGNPIKTFYAELSDLQEQVLGLLGVPLGAYGACRASGGAAGN